MPRKLTASNLAYAADAHRGGATLKDVAQQLRCHPDYLSRRLRAAGVTIIRTGRAPENKNTAHDAEIVSRYSAGDSELAISRALGVDRRLVRRAITEAGIVPRSGSEANLLRFAKMTPEERQRLAAASHDASRGRKRTREELEHRALARSRIRGMGEAELIEALDRLGLEPDGQRPVGVYNVDVAFGSIAVELFSASSNISSRPRFRERLKYIADQGYAIVCVCFRRIGDFLGNFDDLVTFLKVTDGTPPERRKHWVIRCRSQLLSRGSNDLDQGTAVGTTVRFFQTAHELDV